MKPIAITGFNLCNAAGTTRARVLEALANGQSGLRACSIALPFEATCGTIELALPELEGDLAPWTTRTTRLARYLLAGLRDELDRLRSRWKPERTALLLATTTAGADCTEAAYKHYLLKGALPEHYDLWKHHTYGAVLHVMRELTGARGPGFVVSTACTASAKVLASAQRLIAADVIDAAIVGGIDTLCAMTLRGFHSLDALSSRPCQPFSAERAGLNIGEGAALLFVERNESGSQPKNDTLAWLEAVGESSDAYHITAPHPQGRGAIDAMQRALARAGIEPRDVHHVNAHGTGTRLNDIAEARAIEQVFGKELPVVSTKGYTGHTLGAAGATEAIMSLFALLEGWIPPSVGAAPVDEEVNVLIATEKMDIKPKRVLSNSFAFGGNNTAVLLRAA
jgi:3-oxoacyl-[acyl-carrier-protein] synthase-1